MKPFWVLIVVLVATACSGNAEQAKPDKKTRPPTPVTIVPVRADRVQVAEFSVGTIESTSAPAVAAEVIGRVTRVHAEEGEVVSAGQLLAEFDTTDLKIALQAAEADVKRLQALLANQQSTVKRYRRLYQEKTISFDTLEEAEAQLVVLQQELASGKTRQAAAAVRLEKSRIVAPINGRIERRNVSVGDFLDIGMPLFRISDNSRLRLQLPFPETAAARLRPGLRVELSSPTLPDKVLEASIDAIRPMVGSANRAISAVVEVENPGGWHPGASITARVILEERDALLVPQISVVRRPSGLVVYCLDGETAQERIVTTGAVKDGWIEIRSGLRREDTVVADGAGYLTNGAALSVQDTTQ